MYSLLNKEVGEVWAERGINISKGQELGFFQLGSTVVLVFEAENVEWVVQPGQKVKWGDTFAIINKSS